MFLAESPVISCPIYLICKNPFRIVSGSLIISIDSVLQASAFIVGIEGYDFPDFDFSLKGVRSITVDPHKMGLAPIPAGGILFKDESYLKAMNVDSPYLTVKQQSTIVGTRLGATAAATYAVMKHLGREGYRNNAKEALDNAFFLARELEKLGYELVVEPKLNIVAFNHPQIKTEELADLLEKKDWKVSCSHCPKAIRIILMNHIKRHHLIELLKDLKEISESV